MRRKTNRAYGALQNKCQNSVQYLREKLERIKDEHFEEIINEVRTANTHVGENIPCAISDLHAELAYKRLCYNRDVILNAERRALCVDT